MTTASAPRPYLVTGGAGFIGSHLADALLRQGHAVRVLDDLSTGRRENLDPRCELLLGDVADPAAVRRAMEGTAGCFHLAAIASVARSNEDWVGTHRANATGTVAVLDAARSAGPGGRPVPVVYASSAAVYGDQGEGPIREDGAPLRPRTAYGADKLASELHARVAAEVHGVPTLGFRFFNVYGPRQDPSSPYSGVISLFAGRLAAGQAISVHGDGRQTRDFVFVADVVEHLLAGMALLRRDAAAPQAHVLNVCTGRATAILDLAGLLGEALGQGSRPAMSFGAARAGDIRASLGDPVAATAALGCTAATPLEAGLAALAATLLAPGGDDGA
jgi:UDP-glucose 4-epimerase